MQKITMSKVSTPTIEEAFELFLRKCRVKNLTELSIESYKKKMVHFNEFLNGETSLSHITSDTIDNYILYVLQQELCDKGFLKKEKISRINEILILLENEHFVRRGVNADVKKMFPELEVLKGSNNKIIVKRTN